MEATVPGIGSVFGSPQLESIDNLVTDFQGLGDSARIVDFSPGDRTRPAGDREDSVRSESLAGDREQRGAVDPSGQGHENCAVLAQQRDGTLFFTDYPVKIVQFRSLNSSSLRRN